MHYDTPDPIEISEAHFFRLESNCDCVALLTVVCHDPEVIAGVIGVYEVDDAIVVEHLNPSETRREEKYAARYDLYDIRMDGAEVVEEILRDRIEQHRRSDREIPFSWHVEAPTDTVADNSDVMELDGTYVGPERLNPPFDIPTDDPVSIMDIPYEVHIEIKEANKMDVGLPITIERFRGSTYLIGADADDCRTLADACFDRKQDHKQMEFFEAVENADQAESALHRVEPVAGNEVTS